MFQFLSKLHLIRDDVQSIGMTTLVFPQLRVKKEINNVSFFRHTASREINFLSIQNVIYGIIKTSTTMTINRIPARDNIFFPLLIFPIQKFDVDYPYFHACSRYFRISWNSSSLGYLRELIKWTKSFFASFISIWEWATGSFIGRIYHLFTQYCIVYFLWWKLEIQTIAKWDLRVAILFFLVIHASAIKNSVDAAAALLL